MMFIQAHQRKRRALLCVVMVVLVCLLGIAGIGFPQKQAKAATAAMNDTVLFIHGFVGGQSNGSSAGIQGGCNGSTTWGPAESYLRNHGWTGNLYSVGYYQNDYNCDWSTYYGTFTDPTRCQKYRGNEGTNNQDLRNIACEIAWGIWNHYTLAGTNVRIVAHSMGGMIVRYMLHAISMNDTEFPPYLSIPEVVTFATPHGGVQTATFTTTTGIIVDGAGQFACGGCYQIEELDGYSGSFLQDVTSDYNSSRIPGGQGWGTTDWTLMGSVCEAWTNGGVPESSSLANFYGGHEILYGGVPNTTNGCYYHGDYLTDSSDAPDATVTTCYSCGDPYWAGGTSSSNNYPHSLSRMCGALAGTGQTPCQLNPTPTPTPPPPTPTPPPSNLVNNPSFENGSTGWNVWIGSLPGASGSVQEPSSQVASHYGNWHHVHWSDQAYELTTYSDAITIPVAGNYVASAWVQTGCNTVNDWFEVASGGQNISIRQVPACYQGWTLFTLPAVSLSQGQVVNVSFYSRNQANQWIRFDDVSLIRQ